MGLTNKEEMFVQGLFKGLSQRLAYKEAYKNSNKWKDKTIDNKAYVLAKKKEIMARLEELRNNVAEKNEWTIERMIKEFEKNNETSRINEDTRVSNDALKEIGKLCGFYVEKIESKNVNLNKDIDNLTSDEIDKEIELLSKKLK